MCSFKRIGDFCLIFALTSLAVYAQAVSSRPYKVGWYDFTADAARLTSQAAAGASMVLIGANANALSEMDAAQANGIKVIIDLNLTQCTPYPMDATTFTNWMNTFKSHPALYGWNLGDEPELCSNALNFLRTNPGYYNLAKSADPGHPVYVVHSGSLVSAFFPVEDISGVDWYPSANNCSFCGQIPGSYDAWLNGMNTAKANGKQFLALAQAFAYSPWRDLSYDEMRYHALTAVVVGAPIILFYNIQQTDATMYNLASQMMGQIQEIGAEMNNGASNDPHIVVSQPTSNLAYRYGVNGSSKVILAINIANRTGGGSTLSNVSFTLPAGVTTSSVTVLHENRTLPVTSGVFTDSFVPFAVHTYQFNTSSSTDTTPPSIPAGLSATAISASQINVSWTASTDNVGVAGYNVYRGGIKVGTSRTTSYSDAGLSPSTTAAYTVSAYDAVGNTSEQSASASATTQAASISSNRARGILPTGSTAIYNPSYITDGDTNTANWSEVGAGSQWIKLDLGQTYPLNEIKLWHYYGDGRTYHDVIVQLSNDPNFSTGVTTVFNNDINNTSGQGIGTDAEYAETSAGKDISFPPVDARYVRLWTNGNTVNINNHYVEVQVFDASPNLARGIVATGSTTIYNVSYITDGDTNTANWSEVGAGSQWIKLDLGQTYPLNEIKLWHYYDDGRTYHDVIVQLSNDSAFSSGVTTVFNNDMNNSSGQGIGTNAEYAETSAGKDISFSPVNARYVRLWTNANTVNMYNHNVEVQVFGSAANTKPSADTQAPSVPTGLSAAAISASQINLSWTVSPDNVGVAGYRIYRNGVQIAAITGTTYQDSGLATSRTYTYTVAAYDAAGNTSAQSAPVSATTQAVLTISNMQLTQITGSSAVIVWSTNTPADSTVQYGPTTALGQTASLPALTTSHSVSLPDLTRKTTYYYRVASTDATGNQAVSAVFQLTTKASNN
jgi:chitodextrinase